MIAVSNTARVVNIGLRIATLLTRFLFIFVLAKHFDPASVGYYGIFTATVGYAVFFVGLDFYTYVSREIIKASNEHRGQLLKGQLALCGLMYLVILPPTLSLLAQSGWPHFLLWWFAPILFLDHFNQEMSRLLIVLSEQLTASVILFIRQGSWAVVVISLLYAGSTPCDLNTVMALWAAAGIVAAGVGVLKLRQLKTAGWGLPIDWRWVAKGIPVSGALLAGTLPLRGIQTFDRYWLEAMGGIEMVGAYVFLFGIAATLLTFLDAGVFAFAYPNLISLHHQSRHSEAQQQVRDLLLRTIVLSALFGVASWLALPYLLNWIGNPLYQQIASWYPALALAMAMNALSMVPHFALYSRGIDKPLVYSHIAALIGFFSVTFIASRPLGPSAVLLGLNAAFLIILLWKSVAYLSVLGHATRLESASAPT